MALFIKTADHQGLNEAIKKQIKDGKITTWKFVEGRGFTHVTHDGQWENKAYFWPDFTNAEWLILGLHGPADGKVTGTVYAVYHGRFIEMLLSHFGSNIQRVEPTVKKDAHDKFEWKLELKFK